MDIQPAREPMAAAAVALLAAASCIAAFISPLGERVVDSPLLAAVLGIGIGVAVILHLAYVAIVARRLGRSSVGWVAAAVIGFPVVSIAALALLEWHWREQQRDALQPKV